MYKDTYIYELHIHALGRAENKAILFKEAPDLEEGWGEIYTI